MIWPEPIQGVAKRLKVLDKQIPSDKANEAYKREPALAIRG